VTPRGVSRTDERVARGVPSDAKGGAL
jgi:hypothetical protein